MRGRRHLVDRAAKVADSHRDAKTMLYMIIEHFRGGDAVPVYRRFRERGRMAPDRLRYVASWVTEDYRRCFQVMECEDPRLLEQWMSNWRDLVEFEVIAVSTSADAAAGIAPRL